MGLTGTEVDLLTSVHECLQGVPHPSSDTQKVMTVSERILKGSLGVSLGNEVAHC